MSILTIKILTLFFFIVSTLRADQEGPRDVYVVGNGAWYAKCVPSGGREQRESGTTSVYLAGRETDQLMYQFGWYASRIYISGWGGGCSVIRIGPWARGRRASDEHLAIAFYQDGRLLCQYSTLDISGSELNVEFSASHYTVVKEHIGFVHIYEKNEKGTVYSSPSYGFEIVLNDGSHVVFDPKTGSRVMMGFNMFTKPVK